ncbi:MAG: S-layer homology domain-containing protein [Polyangiales bacterium]
MEIESLAGAGILAGFPDGTFRPDRTLTRAEFAAMIAKAFLVDRVIVGNAGFLADVDVDSSIDAVAALRRGRVHLGFRTARCPNAPLRRMEALAALDAGLDCLGRFRASVRATPTRFRPACADAFEQACSTTRRCWARRGGCSGFAARTPRRAPSWASFVFRARSR